MKTFIAVAMTAVALAATPGGAQDKVTLTLAAAFDAQVTENWQTVLDAFSAAHPDIAVKLSTVGGSGASIYPDMLRTAMAGGDPPDVFFMWGGSIASPFIKAGQVRPIDDDYAAFGWAQRFPGWIVERLKVGGKSYGLPLQGRGMGFFYRADIFKAHGLSAPKTYSEFEAVCTALKADGIACASTGGKFGWHVMRLVDYFLEGTCGPEVHDRINALSASWDQPCVVAGYQRLKDWIDRGWLVPDFLNVAPTDARIPVYQGQAAMIMEGGWFEAVLATDEQPQENFDFFVPPTDHAPERYSAFPEQWMISQASRHPKEAARLLDYITSPEVQKAHPRTFPTSPLVGLTPDCGKTPLNCKIVALLQSDRGTYPPTDQAFVKELMDSFFEVQDGIIAGKLTPAEGAKLMQERAAAWKAKQPA